MPLRLPSRYQVVIPLFALLLVGSVFCARVWWRARTVLKASATQAESRGHSGFQLVTLAAVRPMQAERFAMPADFRSATVYRGELFVCGRSALYEYAGGRLLRSWPVGQDLPPYPLTSIAVLYGVGTPELWIGTAGAGLVIYDGRQFRQFLPSAPAARKITALATAANGRVIFGTPGAGVYQTDSRQLSSLHPQFAKAEVTALAGDLDDLWIGTRADGAWHWKGGEAVHFTSELPDVQVLSIASEGSLTWIGTPLGVAEFSAGRLTRRLAAGLFAQAVAASDDTLWVGTADQGTVAVRLGAPTPPRAAASVGADIFAAVSFFRQDRDVFAVSRSRIVRAGSEDVIAAAPEGALAGGHITALHADRRGQLWVGYFDRGMDMVDLSGREPLKHFEDDVLFCINRIKESSDGIIGVATANGLALIDRSRQLRRVLDRHSGLIASHVTDLLFRGEDMTIATPAGISFVHAGAIDSLYAFQGLVNNHVYTLADANGATYAGTLGGLSLLQGGLVRASFSTANSALRQNWITASAAFDGALYLGTYGSGIVRMDDRGTITGSGGFGGTRTEINLNAMSAGPWALYAGTAGHGLAILRRGEERWTFVDRGLPSRNVTAVEVANGWTYIGTDNGLVRIPENQLIP